MTSRSAALAALVAVLALFGLRAIADASPSTGGSLRPAPSLSEVLRGERSRTIGRVDGEVPDGITVFDDQYPGVSRLHPDLLSALREAATDAGRDGIEVRVNSGWRSKRYQRELFRQAVAEHGSTAEAERWVARPGRSVHEQGEAVDLGDATATAWLARHGDEFGLCRVYEDEPWHFELRPGAVDHGCPATYDDPTEDPRLSTQR